MRKMQQRMERTMMRPLMSPQAPQRPEPNPMEGFLGHLVRHKMRKQHKRLKEACEEELEGCPLHGDEMMQCLISKSDELGGECEDRMVEMKHARAEAEHKVRRKHQHITAKMQRVCETELATLCPSKPASPLMTIFRNNQNLLDHKLACLVKKLDAIESSSRCHRLVRRTANKWGQFEVRQAKRLDLEEKLASECNQQPVCQRKRCPLKKLKCLAHDAQALNERCRMFVQYEHKELKQQEQRHDRKKAAHKACKKQFKKAKKQCKHSGKDVHLCISRAKQTKIDCHSAAEDAAVSVIRKPELLQDAEQWEADPPAPTRLPGDPFSYRHQIVTSPGVHCLELKIPGAESSPFWKAEGWKYSAPVRPEWVAGACDHTKWTSVDSTTNDYDGYTTAKNAPYPAVSLVKRGIKTQQAMRQPSPSKASTTRSQMAAAGAQLSAKAKQVYSHLHKNPVIVMALVGLVVLMLAGVVCVVMQRRGTERYELESMHMKLIASGRRHAADDQL